MTKASQGVAIVSGGLDSVTMLHYLARRGYKPHVLSFEYGQRHIKELDFAGAAADRFDLQWTLIRLVDYGDAIRESNSSLVNMHVDVPEGHYAADTMKATVVPNRNMIMTSLATGVCIAEGGHYVAAAPHNGDAAIYPDCRPAFWNILGDTVRVANQGFIADDWHFELPFIEVTKTVIAHIAAELKVPVHLTWSCYQGRDIHCGRCGTCVERLEALHAAQVDDKTPYEDPDFWKTQVGVS
jgi:7-cyano-7-deazaguanine synthase